MRRLTTHELRESFLVYFAAKGHARVKSDALVPANDPSVLFTSAGMNQFKDYFLGKKTDLSRAASCQKCFRTGDLDEVGATPFHHTFFEMLGNFSFGDYFKKEACLWAWEYVTQVLEIDPKDLWVSVYEDDPEALDIWKNAVGLVADNIKKLGPKDNFWPSNAIQDGPNGPCGPCSEIYFKKSDSVSVEVWNLVFTQFDRRDGGALAPLPNKNIDTGMGLERMSSVLQAVGSNFEIDIFVPIVAAAEKAAGTKDTRTLRMLADHARAVTFCIGDGVLPSNDGRGYVLRKLIRRCHFLLAAAAPQPFLYKIVSSVADVMRGPYPEVLERRDNIAQIICVEEEKFIRNILEGGQERLAAVLAELKGKGQKTLPPEVGLDLYVTHGIQPSFTAEVCAKAGIGVDQGAVEILIGKERASSRAASKMATNIFAGDGVTFKPSGFTGYDSLTQEARVTQIVANGKEAVEAPDGAPFAVVLDKTPFYGQQGGQIGDTGRLKDKTGRFLAVIQDTQKQDKAIVQEARLEAGARLAVGDTVIAEVDADRRQAIRRAHTATHILQAVLRRVLGVHVQQAGSFVEPDRFRFDFTHFKEISAEEMEDIQRLLNEYVIRNDHLTVQVMSKTEAQKTGAIALFGEKYEDTVRVVSIAGYSKEFCGGTHLDLTGDIGMVFITASSSVGSGLRRIEALTGKLAFDRVFDGLRLLSEVAERLKTSGTQVLSALDQQAGRIKAMERELVGLQERDLERGLDEIVAAGVKIKDVRFITHRFSNADVRLLRRAADMLKDRVSKAAVFFLSATRGADAFFVCGLTPDVVKRGLSADALIKDVLGQGGGRPDFAQGGTKDAGAADKIFSKAKKALQEAL